MVIARTDWEKNIDEERVRPTDEEKDQPTMGF